MVHLFEWKWADIARECETFLAPNGYGGVQVSPPFENTVIGARPWWERYQPVSFKIVTRSGNEAAFADMTRRCNAVGIRIYVDLLLNHMSATTGVGTGGSTANAQTKDYPAVPFTAADFHAPCEINWNNADSIRRCQLVGLPDLDQSRENVRAALVDAMNHLVDLGVAGFRADAMKHMWPADLENMFGRVKNLNTAFGFAPNLRPFVVGEVIDNGGESISATEYFGFGTTTEFRYSNDISRTFKGGSALRWLSNFGEGWGFHPSNRVLSFVDNHGK
jgi:alpha-amylase